MSMGYSSPPPPSASSKGNEGMLVQDITSAPIPTSRHVLHTWQHRRGAELHTQSQPEPQSAQPQWPCSPFPSVSTQPQHLPCAGHLLLLSLLHKWAKWQIRKGIQAERALWRFLIQQPSSKHTDLGHFVQHLVQVSSVCKDGNHKAFLDPVSMPDPLTAEIPH